MMYFEFKLERTDNTIGRKLLKSCKGIDQREHTHNSDEEDMNFEGSEQNKHQRGTCKY